MYVVKLGGATGNDASNVVAGMEGMGPCVLVHGGSAAVDDLCVRLGHPPKRFVSPSGFESRRTDAATIEAVVMAMAGRVNTELVTALQASGINALGLSGVDGRLLVGRRRASVRIKEDGRVKSLHDDRSGTVDSVNADLLRMLLACGYTPVVSPPILDGEDGGPLNADADRIAAKIASALPADVLVLLTNVEGFRHDASDPDSVVGSLSRDELTKTIPVATGGMKKKLLAAQEALAGGVGRVIIADSRRKDPLRAALRGEGTVIL